MKLAAGMFLSLSFFMVVSCGGGDQSTFVVHGTIEDVQMDAHSVRIDHEEIPGVMTAMAMTYPVTDDVSLEELEVGDHVMFELEMLGEGQYEVSSIEEEAVP